MRSCSWNGSSWLIQKSRQGQSESLICLSQVWIPTELDHSKSCFWLNKPVIRSGRQNTRGIYRTEGFTFFCRTWIHKSIWLSMQTMLSVLLHMLKIVVFHCPITRIMHIYTVYRPISVNLGCWWRNIFESFVTVLVTPLIGNNILPLLVHPSVFNSVISWYFTR